VEEAGALRRAEPLVAVARVEVRADGIDVEVELARRVCAVDDDEDVLGERDGRSPRPGRRSPSPR
jgi:hypothetical protein